MSTSPEPEQTYTADVLQYTSNGRKYLAEIKLPLSTWEAYKDMQSYGCRIEIELIDSRLAIVSITSEKKELDRRFVDGRLQEAISCLLDGAKWRAR